MTIAITMSVIAGIAIGFRFKIYMVLPVIAAVALAVAVFSVGQGETIWSSGLAIIMSAIGVQIGYLCGTFALSIKEMPAQGAAPAQTASADLFPSRSRTSV